MYCILSFSCGLGLILHSKMNKKQRSSTSFTVVFSFKTMNSKKQETWIDWYGQWKA